MAAPSWFNILLGYSFQPFLIIIFGKSLIDSAEQQKITRFCKCVLNLHVYLFSDSIKNLHPPLTKRFRLLQDQPRRIFLLIRRILVLA